MSQRVTVSIVGVDSPAEQRLGMALQLLAASGLHARVMPWDGTRRDIVIADVDDAYGRSALALVQRRGDGALAVSCRKSGHDDAVAVATTQLTELVRRIKTVVSTAAQPTTAPGKSSAGGLLQLCIEHRELAGDLLAQSGASSIVIRREASRIMAPSHSDLASARSQLLSDGWTVTPLGGAEDAPRTQAAAAQSLDAFLIEACEAVRRDLPLLSGDRHCLHSWPDLGSIPDNTHALRLSSALVRGSWSLDALAEHCNVERGRANAFCWATRASGLLTSDSAAPAEPPGKRASRAFSGSLLSRLARRFNLSFGAEAHDAR